MTHRNDRQVDGINEGQQRGEAPRMRRGEVCRMVWTRNHERPSNWEPYFMSLLSHNFPLHPLPPNVVHQLEKDLLTILRNAEINAQFGSTMEAAQQQGWLTSHLSQIKSKYFPSNSWWCKYFTAVAQDSRLSARRAQINQAGLPPRYIFSACDPSVITTYGSRRLGTGSQNNWMPRQGVL